MAYNAAERAYEHVKARILTGELDAPPLFVAVRLGLFSLLPLALVRFLRWLEARATRGWCPCRR